MKQPNITPELVLNAYRKGIFPIAESRSDPELQWCFPKKRGIIPLNRFHVPKKLGELFCEYPFKLTVNKAFAEVVKHCAEDVTPKRPDSWINPVLESLYVKLHKKGHAHSVECWRGEELVGGLFGMSIGGMFCGESMFSHVSNASKIALVALVVILRNGGYQLLDTQYASAHLQQFGAIEIPSSMFLRLLRRAVEVKSTFKQPAEWELSEQMI